MLAAPEANGSAGGQPDACVAALLGVYQSGDEPALAFPALVRAAEAELGLGVGSVTVPSSSAATERRGARAPASLRSERIANRAALPALDFGASVGVFVADDAAHAGGQ